MTYYKLLLFVRESFVSLKLRLLGCQNVSSFKNVDLSVLRGMRFKESFAGGDSGEFVVLAERLIPSLNELRWPQNTAIAAAAGVWKVVDQLREIPQHNEAFTTYLNNVCLSLHCVACFIIKICFMWLLFCSSSVYFKGLYSYRLLKAGFICGKMRKRGKCYWLYWFQTSKSPPPSEFFFSPMSAMVIDGCFPGCQENWANHSLVGRIKNGDMKTLPFAVIVQFLLVNI